MIVASSELSLMPNLVIDRPPSKLAAGALSNGNDPISDREPILARRLLSSTTWVKGHGTIKV